MKSLNRKPLTKAQPVSQLAQMEMDQWIAERNQRFALNPVGTQPHWVKDAAKWSA